MVHAPSTYAEWTVVLNAFADRLNDDEIVPAMHEGSLVWQAGVAERFSQRLVDAVNKRMDSAIERFQRDQKRANGDERVLHHALRALRNEFVTIINALDIKALPEDHRARYMQLVKSQADSVQNSLETSAAQVDRSGKLLHLIKNTPVNRF